MAELTHERIAELRELLADATSRPWREGPYRPLTPIRIGNDNCEACSTLRKRDAELIVAAVNLLPALLDAAERGLNSDGRIDSALADMVDRERARYDRLAKAAQLLVGVDDVYGGVLAKPELRWQIDNLAAALAEQPATEEQG